MEDWYTISDAFNMVREGTVNRIDGDSWKVYVAGSIIRIDITQGEN